jgi:signal transduction histidine kinase
MNSDVAILLIAGIFNLLLSSFVLFRNPKLAVNRTFAAFGLSVILWTSFNYLADHVANYSLIFTRLTLFFGACIGVSLFVLSIVFPRSLKIGKRLKYFFFGFAALVLSLCLTPGFVASVKPGVVSAELTVGALYPIFVLYLVTALTLIIRNYIKQYRRGNQVDKNQIRLLLTGIIVYSVLAILSNVILPIVSQTWSSSRYGPIFTVPFIGITAYAMIKHGLFDIRLVVARSIGYVFTLLTISVFFVLIGFGFLSRFLGTGSLTQTQQALYITITVIIALSFQSIKSFFDKISRSVFYRDAYDPQVFLDQLNKVLVSTIELDVLLQSSAQVIADNLKAGFCVFKIEGHDEFVNLKSAVSKEGTADNDGLEQIEAILAKRQERICVADSLENDNDLQTLLSNNNIAIAAKMVNSTKQGLHTVGYLFLGVKKSGNPYNSQDIRMVDIVVNELVIATQNALRFEEIQNFARTLQEKVDEATRKLRLTNEKLRQLDQTKDDFISMASHQLRTPLTSVKGYVSMVLDEDAGAVNPQQRKLLDQAFISSQRMVYLIADLLNVSRLKTGKFIIEAKPTNLAQVVESELDQLKETAKGRDLKLSFQRPKNFPTLNLDETKIRQVIMNFSDNAIYYTPAGGTITVSLVDKPESVELIVVDNGIGVPKAEQHHLFTKFYRAGNAKKARPDGTGLGLFMAQKVIVAQGGAIIFHSEENKGSTFGFSFPKAKLLVK